jgi:predicted DNA-binding transcriptional regulator YafY
MGVVRADRLVAALLVLQAKGKVTAAELASELEVSERTARRDLEGLALAGVPVYSQPGRGGGWELIGGARTDLTGLTAEETKALFLVAGPATGDPALRAALRKLVRALPETFRVQAQAAAGAVIYDPDSWDHRSPDRPEHLAELQQALVDEVQVELDYIGRAGRPTSRTVHPLGLVVKNDRWYLVAQTGSGQRTFRVDRVTSARLTDRLLVRPEGFDLVAAWRSIVTDVAQRRAPTLVHLCADPDVVGVLRWLFGTRVVPGEERPDGRLDVQLRVTSEQLAARQLAGVADRIDVLEPAIVRDELAAIGRRLVERHGRVDVPAGR